MDMSMDRYIIVGDISSVKDRDVVVFDLDGVLVNNNDRYVASLREISPDIESHEDLDRFRKDKFWKIFLSDKYIHLDKPVRSAIDMLNEARQQYKIVIITGRTSNMLDATLKQLKEFGISYDVLVMRREGDFTKDVLFKRMAIEKLNLNPVYIHDDSIDVVVEMLRWARIGVFYWYRVGEYMFVPSMAIYINGKRYILAINQDDLRNLSVSGPVEIQYASYRFTLSQDLVYDFIDMLHSLYVKKFCYPECFEYEEIITIYDVLRLDAKGFIRINNKTYPSVVDLDLDKLFSDIEIAVKAWKILRESKLLEE